METSHPAIIFAILPEQEKYSSEAKVAVLTFY
jgi:hypothetical protein